MRGWIQYRSVTKHDGMPSFCMSGAISAASGWDFDSEEPSQNFDHTGAQRASAVVAELLREKKGYESIVAFNDDRRRTKEDVIEILTEAIEKVS